MADSESHEAQVIRTMPPVMRLMLALPIAIGGLVVWTVLQRGDTWAALESMAMPVLVGAILSYVFLRAAHTIVIHKATGIIEFRTVVGTHAVHVRDVVAIRSSFLQHGQLIVKHPNGAVAMPSQFSGLHAFVSWVRDQNPNVALKGL